MTFPIDLTATLTGASIFQLRRWRRTGLLTPEVQPYRPPLYSFRDVVAVRTVVWLRTEVSLQKIRKALANLPVFDFTEHPARYKFATDGKSIGVLDEHGQVVDLVSRPGQIQVFSLADVFKEFENKQGRHVVDFQKPRDHLEVRAARLGGWPTVEHTRVPYDDVANLLRTGDITPDQVSRFYPSVSAAAARDALEFDTEVRSSRAHAA
jgi:uncharacterized protein (DUF433 family)